jgi:hypothetical protein
VAIDTAAKDENITLELELELEVPPKNRDDTVTSQNPSHFQKPRASDGISRRFYPRIFTYSADYPEK